MHTHPKNDNCISSFMTTKKFDAIVEIAGKVDANYAAQIEGYCSLLGEYGKKFEAVCAMLALDLIGVKVFRYSDETAEAVASGEKLLKESQTVYESFADMMSPEDAKRYLDFLENGSREGLTSAELADALLVSQKVGYEDVWDLRNVGDALESGNYSSLRELMLPEEVARYDEHWLDVAEKISNEALDNQIDFIKNGGITKPGGGAYKPAKISAAVDLNTGDIYFGYNGANKFNPSIQEIHPDLQQRINRTMSLAGNSIDNEYASRMSFEKWSVDNCAEIYSVNNALQNQATLDNIFINTKYFKDGKYALPCRNCQVTFEGCLFPKQ